MFDLTQSAIVTSVAISSDWLVSAYDPSRQGQEANRRVFSPEVANEIVSLVDSGASRLEGDWLELNPLRQALSESRLMEAVSPINYSMEDRVVLVSGPPGSGKGTLCQALKAMNPAFVHVSVGDEIRKILKDPDHPVTKQYGDRVREGNLLPDEIVGEIVDKILRHESHSDKVILLDGYPRTPQQLSHFENNFSRRFSVLNLQLDDNSAIDRILHRGENRVDDKRDIAIHRLEEFERNTQPMLDRLIGANENLIFSIPTGSANKGLSKQESIQATSQLAFSRLNQVPAIKAHLGAEGLEDEVSVNPRSDALLMEKGDDKIFLSNNGC